MISLDSGMAGSFTTILIEQFGKLDALNATLQEDMAMMEAMIGSFQDIPPIIVAIIGGFLQQLLGPRRVLILSAVPNILSWLLITINYSSVKTILLSRVSAGLANGLLTGNVYLSNIASPKNIGSFKMIEVRFRKAIM